MWKHVLFLLCLLGSFASARAQDISHYEYWLDGDYADRVTVYDSDTAISVALALADAAAGLHFFNLRATNSEGEVSTVYRTLFFVQDTLPTAALKEYEYWLDGDYAQRTYNSKAGDEVAVSADVSHLPSGLHFFCFRAFDDNGQTSNVYRTLFYLPEADPVDIAGYEYWFDNDSTQKVTANGHEPSIILAADVSHLSEGVHTFYFRARNSSDAWGPVYEEEFEVLAITDLVESPALPQRCDVYNLNGELVLRNASRAALRKLPPTMYVIGGRKVLLR